MDNKITISLFSKSEIKKVKKLFEDSGYTVFNLSSTSEKSHHDKKERMHENELFRWTLLSICKRVC